MGCYRLCLALCLAIPVFAAMLYQVVLPSSWNPLGPGDELYQGIAEFYDHSTAIWEAAWGGHLHSGWYNPDVDTSNWTLEDHNQAQILMMKNLLELWPGGMPNKSLRILDVGCGIGGSSRFLYRQLIRFGNSVEVTGITLSQWQQKRATEITRKAGDIPVDGVRFLVANALSTGFPDETFDLVWSLESAEHFPSKDKWLQEVKRVLIADGALLCATWCQRDTSASPLSSSEKTLLGRISKNYALPEWVSLGDYGRLLEDAGFIGFQVSQQSWTVNVLPFWPAVIRSALQPSILFKVLASLPAGGWTTFKGAVTALLMLQGFRENTLDFGVFAVAK